MRVIAGTARSLPLKTPAGGKTRPTTDRIKETLFNMLQTYIADAVFIDFCCGSGGIGIEAISRGASKAYFIENDKEAISCLKDNLNFTKFMDKSIILSQDALNAVYQLREKADIIFMDPPYDSGLDISILSLLRDSACISEDTLIIVETAMNRDVQEFEACGYEIVKEKKYKTNKHLFLYKNRK